MSTISGVRSRVMCPLKPWTTLRKPQLRKKQTCDLRDNRIFFFSAVLNCQEKLKVFRWCGLCVTKEELFFYYLHLYTGKKQKHLHDKCNKCSYFWNIWMNMWNWGLGYTQRLQQGPLRTNICMKKEVEVLLREHFTGHLFRWLQYD